MNYIKLILPIMLFTGSLFAMHKLPMESVAPKYEANQPWPTYEQMIERARKQQEEERKKQEQLAKEQEEKRKKLIELDAQRKVEQEARNEQQRKKQLQENEAREKAKKVKVKQELITSLHNLQAALEGNYTQQKAAIDHYFMPINRAIPYFSQEKAVHDQLNILIPSLSKFNHAHRMNDQSRANTILESEIKPTIQKLQSMLK